ncbi:hypothetical protein [Oceanospirillum sediminis]|uniref:Uncharacterized protein n=1 Tax=Oceanospirillum sediminis TaxID=2760088 RepID=A0A839IMU2_9GAMM|nr:hypothetical protein [Oceanospirillum sediminis]MBB1485797.1 hypothetical protein [Oceanospirillum sediminis]
MFISTQMKKLSGKGAYLYREFTIGSTSSFEFIFASDYQAQAIIIDKSDLSRFIQGSSVNYYAGFNNKYGITSVTLSPGKYAVAIRNTVNGDNVISYELDYSEAKIDGYEYVSTDIKEVTSVNGNGWLVQPFTVTDGYVYQVDGLSTGLKSYVIPASDIASFKARGRFNYYTDYSSGSVNGSQPGAMVLNLSAGNYALAFYNDDSDSKKLVYRFSRYKQKASSGNGSTASYADRVFNDIENNYSYYFPSSTRYGSATDGEYYYRSYTMSTGRTSFVLEWDGDLWYLIDGGEWNYWGPISNWSL